MHCSCILFNSPPTHTFTHWPAGCWHACRLFPAPSLAVPSAALSRTIDASGGRMRIKQSGTAVWGFEWWLNGVKKVERPRVYMCVKGMAKFVTVTSLLDTAPWLQYRHRGAQVGAIEEGD